MAILALLEVDLTVKDFLVIQQMPSNNLNAF